MRRKQLFSAIVCLCIFAMLISGCSANKDAGNAQTQEAPLPVDTPISSEPSAPDLEPTPESSPETESAKPQKLQQSQVLAGADGYSINRSESLPEDAGGRTLTDEQIAELDGLTPEEASWKIETITDAYIWLARQGYASDGMHTDPTPGYDYDVALENYALYSSELRDKSAISWIALSTIINLLLEGDYEEVGTLLCIAGADDPNWPFYHMSFNYVLYEGVYFITDSSNYLENMGWPCCRAYTICTSSLDYVKSAMEEINPDTDFVTMAVYPLDTYDIKVVCSEYPERYTFRQIEGVKHLYSANEEQYLEYERLRDADRAKEYERWVKHASTLSVSDYGMPEEIGNTTIGFEAALELVGQDPELVAEQVKTVGDVLQYMIASRFGYSDDPQYMYTPWYGRWYSRWGFDAPGDVQLSQNFGCCCGGYANAVSYLLQGDYEKVGTLRWIGGSEYNHTISWVYTQGKYYVFDFTAYCDDGNYTNYGAPVTILDTLEDYYNAMPDCYPKDEVLLLVAFEAGTAMYPASWNDLAFDGLTFPEEAKDKIMTIYQASPQYGVIYKELDAEIPGWNS